MEGIDVKVLREYARPIFHMRRQIQRDRFGLILGAGFSKPWGMPNWKELNERIAKDTAVKGKALLNLDCSDTLLTQRLFEHYKMMRYRGESEEQHHTVYLDRCIRKEWRDIIHRQLYANAPEEDKIKIIESKHPYVSNYVKLIRQIPLTVNYNFDDFVERILASHRDENEKERTRGFETAWDIRFPLRSEKRVVYHPNGYLPHNLMEASEEIVLSEDEFAEQLLGAMTGQNASLIHHLSRHTCLLIGLSLEDATLKHLLRQVARANPGQYHYYVHYCEPNKKPDESQKKAIINANFDTYNLRTLFLCNEELAALGELIGKGCDSDEHKDRDIRQIAQSNDIRTHYCYYVVGAIGVGKSTVVRHFRNLIAFDEWFEPRSLKLGKDPDKLSSEEVAELDKWIAEQFAMKNHKLCEESSGVFIIDRCPLDPVSFTPAEKWSEKASALLTKIAPGSEQRVMDGHVILLINDPNDLKLRLIMTEKKYTKDRLIRMQKELKVIYKMKGVHVIDISKMTIPEIIRRIARIIYLDSYEPPADIHVRPQEIKEDKVKCPT